MKKIHFFGRMRLMNTLELTPTSIIILAFIFIALVVLAYYFFSRYAKKTSEKKYNKYGTINSIGTCPICGTILEKGESVITAVYPNGTNDRLCSIYGCPHCYHVTEPNTIRRCPVCKKEIGPDCYLIARDFTRKDGSEHIHILGCTRCRFSKS